MTTPSLGALLHAFLTDELPLRKGLRPASVKAHRDALRLFLVFIAADVPCRLSHIALDALTLDRVRRFLQYLQYLEETRHNHRRTRNHRLTVLHAFFEFLARRVPECLAVAQQVAGIPFKRVRHRRHDFSTGIRLLSSSLNCPRTDALLSAIARSCSSCTTPRRGFKKSPISALRTSSLGRSRTFVCTARATSGLPVPSGNRHRSCFNNYSTLCPPLHLRRPSSRPTADGASRGSASTKSSAAIRLSCTLLKWALHDATSALTFFDILLPVTFSNLALIPT